MSFGIPTDVYLSADEEWISHFFGRTQLSTSEIVALIRDMPAVLRGEKSCRSISAALAVKTYRDLNVKYLHKMLGSVGVGVNRLGSTLMSAWSLRAFHDRNYVRFMTGVAAALQESFLTGNPIRPWPRRVTDNLILHTENQLRFPVEAVKGIYEKPTAGNITRAFGHVKDAIRFNVPINDVSKRLVSQAIKYDIASLEYMNEILGVGPVGRKLSGRIFSLYSETLETVSAL